MKKKLTRKEKVRKSQLRNKLKQAKLEIKFGFGFVVLGLIFILFFGDMWIHRNDEIKKEELLSIKGTLVNKLEVKWGKTNGNSIAIQLDEYPQVKYSIGDLSMSRLNVSALQDNIKIGDKIQVDIMKDDLEKNESDKRRKISIFGLRDDEYEYLNVSSFNWAIKKDRNSISMYVILAFSFGMFGYGIYMVVKNKKR